MFVPTAFIPGISGRFYQQFAVTIAAATVISAFNSLTLSPALAALLLKPHDTAQPQALASGGGWRTASTAASTGCPTATRATVGFVAGHRVSSCSSMPA